MKHPIQQPQKMKFIEKIKPPVSILFTISVIVSLFLFSYILFNQYNHKRNEAFITKTGAEPKYFGYIQPKVVDGFSEEPLEGAVVVIPETGQKFITASDGLTAVIKVPIEEDVHYAGIAPKPWSEITLIVYKEDYIEYVLCHTHVWENQTRKGPAILLFPKVDGEENEPFSVVEGPHRLWVRDLVDKFRPER